MPAFDPRKRRREVRQEAWAEYEDRRDRKGYTTEQLKCFMAGMAVMWRLAGNDRPLFTYGPDGKPNELRDELH